MHLEFAEQIKRETGILTGAVGMITTPEQAQGIIETEQADVVLLAREFLRDAYFPLTAAQELGYDVPHQDGQPPLSRAEANRQLQLMEARAESMAEKRKRQGR